MKRNKKPEQSPPAIPSYRVAAVLIAVSLCLLGVFAVRLHIEQLSGHSLQVFAHSKGSFADWFLACKEQFYFLLAAGICCYAAGERLFPDQLCRINPLYRRSALLPVCCIGGYFVLSCLSAVFSENQDVVLFGICTEYEGLTALFSYCILFFFGYNFIAGRQILGRFARVLLVFAAVCAVLAAFEYTLIPLLELPFMKYLIAPPLYREAAATIERSNDFREAVLMFYNANYAGMFFVLLLPMPVYGILAGKRPVVRIACAVLAAAMAAAVIMTNITTAFYVMIGEMLLLLVILLVKRALRIKPLLASIAAFAVLTVIFSLGTQGAFVRTLTKSATNAGTYAAGEQVYRLKTLRISGRTLYLGSESSGYTVMPPYDDGEMLRILADAGTDYTVTDQSDLELAIHDAATDADLSFTVLDGILYVDAGYESTIDFAVTTDGLQLIGQNGALLRTIPTGRMADSPLTRYNSLFTGRGFIWLETLPVLKECLVLGKGAGNFPFCFVQNNVIGLLNTEGNYHFVIDKPHCMYLQIAVTSGIPALLCIVVLFAGFVILGMGVLCRAEPSAYRDDTRLMLLLCLYTGLCGYMVTGIINDSSITVSPVFWLLLGTGYSLCIRAKQGGEEV